MKTTLTALLIIFYLNVNAQALKMIEEPQISFIVNKNNSPQDYVLIGYDTGKIEIQGDTIKAIKHLASFIKQLQYENEQKYICISKAVNFTNTVPDYFCKNQQWKSYQIELKKQGYKTVATKKNKKIKP